MITVRAVYVSGVITPEEQDKINFFKKTLNDGDLVEISLKKYSETRSDRAFRYFHAIIDRYAKELGLSKVLVKNEMCIQHGIAVEYNEKFTPPEWRGRFVDYYGEIYFRKSTIEYTIEEMSQLIKGALLACSENGVNIDDLIIEYGDVQKRAEKQER